LAKLKRRTLPNDHGLTHPQEMLRRTLERKSRTAPDPLHQFHAKNRIRRKLGLPPLRPPIDRYPPDRLRTIRATTHNHLGALRR
jgi:hypothetical protein